MLQFQLDKLKNHAIYYVINEANQTKIMQVQAAKNITFPVNMSSIIRKLARFIKSMALPL